MYNFSKRKQRERQERCCATNSGESGAKITRQIARFTEVTSEVATQTRDEQANERGIKGAASRAEGEDTLSQVEFKSVEK